MFLDSVQPTEPSVYHRLHDVLLRTYAIALIILACFAWLRVVGYFENTNWRFDLMPTHWQVATVLMAVVGPVAASGLWLLSSWGAALWLGLALFQIVIFSIFSDIFEPRPILVAFHAICVLGYVATALRIYFIERKYKQ